MNNPAPVPAPKLENAADGAVRKTLKPLSDRLCKCGRHKVPIGQNVCRRCNREAVQRYNATTRHASVIAQFEALTEGVYANLFNNPDTRAIYECRHGQVATCTLKPSADHVYGRIRVIAVAFLPGKLIRVQGEDDPRVQLSVSIDDLERDDRAPDLRPEILMPGAQKRDLRLLKALLEGKPVEGLVVQSEAERRREAQLRAKWTPISESDHPNCAGAA